MKLIRASHDKPHRCNECWSIPQAIYDGKGGARWNHTYRCTRCDVRWWKGYSDDMAFTWFRGPVRHTKSRFFRRMRRMAYGLHLRNSPY